MKIGQGPSLVWKNIHNALNLLKVGLKWKLGNGKKIKIWGEKWLPNQLIIHSQPPTKNVSQESTVADLIDEASKS